jgi:hypothetical protein
MSFDHGDLEVGGCLRKSLAERPGKLVRDPFVNAFSKVDNARENKVAWANVISSAVVWVPRALACSSCSGNFTSHILLVWFCCPVYCRP